MEMMLEFQSFRFWDCKQKKTIIIHSHLFNLVISKYMVGNQAHVHT